MLCLKIKVSLCELFELYGSSCPQPKKASGTSSTSGTTHATSSSLKGSALDAQQLLTLRYKMDKGTLGDVKKKK